MTAMIFFLRLISYTPFLGGVIVPAVQVVQARLGVVDVPAIAQGIRGAEGGGHAARYTSMCRRTGDCLWRRR